MSTAFALRRPATSPARTGSSQGRGGVFQRSEMLRESTMPEEQEIETACTRRHYKLASNN